jgi:acid phosphatase class B
MTDEIAIHPPRGHDFFFIPGKCEGKTNHVVMENSNLE